MRNLLYKLFRFEFWPWYMLYIPLLPIYILGVLYTRRLLYFTAANPSIDMGGFFGEKKDEILRLINTKYTVKSLLVKSNQSKPISNLVKSGGFEFPLIVKPNVGERGDDVYLLSNLNDLENYARQGFDFIIQEFVDLPIELGVLFNKDSRTGKVEVTSIAEKEFLHVYGDGYSTVNELMRKNPRSSLYMRIIKEEYPHRLSVVPKLGERYVIHKIGNHVKGTRFINANYRINSAITQSVQSMVTDIKGVNFGRFDLKIQSYEDFENDKGIKVFEMNGVSSEPAHIYGLSNYFLALKDLAQHWFVIIGVSKRNIKKGVKPTVLPLFLQQVRTHFNADIELS